MPIGARAQATSCDSLLSFTYPNTTISGVASMPGGPYVAPDTWHLAFTNLPPWCQVTATIAPTPDSSIGVQVWLPMQGYNGRFLGTGNGGYAGSYFQSELAQGINNGFATANTDMGTSPYSAGVTADGLAGHPEKWVDFGWRSTHLMTGFAQALVQAFYGSPANRSYFAGCSTGGQQALMEAQRFPSDYDGILAGAPAHNRTHLHTALIAQYAATHQSAPATGFIPATKLDVVNQAVLNQCVAHGHGAPSDTFLTDPRQCKFDPATLQCPGNVNGASCLTTDQIAAMDAYYEGSINPSNGVIINPGATRGSETSNVAALGFAFNESDTEPSFDSLFKWVFGLGWQWQTFDFNQNVAQVDQVLADDLNATSTDLSAFNNRGGKLILYHGWADPLIPSPGTINYYDAVIRTMFGSLSDNAIAQTQSFARLYMAPGVWHCGMSLAPGPGPNSFGGMIQQPAPSFDPQHDLLSALTQWVESGVAPGPVIATKYNNDNPQLGIQMQRPICVFPQIPQYNGSGDPTQPGSFQCIADHPVNYNGATASHDYNGDGKSDVGWKDSGGDIGMWLMNGATLLASGGVANAPTVWSVVGQRDFDGDGNTDLLWQDTNGDVGMWLMNGTRVVSSAGVATVPTVWSVAGTGDFNGDGVGDVLWHDTSGNVGIWLMNGTQILQSIGIGNASPVLWTIAGTGDFNGDGRTDVLWIDISGDVGIWFMNGTQIAQAVGIGRAPPGWSVVGTGDFNGDGMTDILWRDAAGDVGVWLMNGSTVAMAAGIGSAPSIWSVAAAGDFNGDGMSDVLWRDSSGNVGIWFMDGAQISSATGIGAASTAWSVQSAGAD